MLGIISKLFTFEKIPLHWSPLQAGSSPILRIRICSIHAVLNWLLSVGEVQEMSFRKDSITILFSLDSIAPVPL